MARAGQANPAGMLGDVARFKELRERLLFLIGALIVYRVGTFIPVPGIDPVALEQFFNAQQGTILTMFDMFSGGALKRLSIFALGVMPYISASIVLQMATHVVEPLKQLRKEGESGRRKITQYTRYATVILSSFQAIAAASALQSQNVVLNPGTGFILTAAITLVTGTIFLMWLGEQITERGVGNGISMIILASILSRLPSAIGNILELVSTGGMSQAMPFVIAIVFLGVIFFVVFMERAQRRITVNYAKRQQGRRMYAGQTSHLPFKINMSGVIPPIFASSLILFPATIAQLVGSGQSSSILTDIAATLSRGQPVYILLYTALIMFFCFFYTALVFNSRDTAENLQRSGAFIPGIRPGQQTADYIDKVLTRLTFWGALYITAVCLLPELMSAKFSLPVSIGGTSMLIIVVVSMDFMAQLQAHMMTHQYEGLMKKANLKGYGRRPG
jgi:preprotein translocase subunit SecY